MAINRNQILKKSIFSISSLMLIGVLVGCSTNETGSKSNQMGHMSMSQSTNMSPKMNMQLHQKSQAPHPIKFTRNGNNVSIDMFTEMTNVEISPGVQFPAWTFDGTAPGPVIQLHEGDNVKLTLHNLDPDMSHSIDLHAAFIPPNENFLDVAPGKTRTITFDAKQPGVYMYHCESSPMPLHIAQGMYGAVIVTRKGEQPPTYTIVQSEFYKPLDFDSVLNGKPNYVVFNGQANQYVIKPLNAKIGQPVTIAFVNAGPNDFSAFHVVGSILRDVQVSGNPQNNLYNIQTYTVAPGDGTLIKLKFDRPGTYTFVSHSMSSVGKGAIGRINVSE